MPNAFSFMATPRFGLSFTQDARNSVCVSLPESAVDAVLHGAPKAKNAVVQANVKRLERDGDRVVFYLTAAEYAEANQAKGLVAEAGPSLSEVSLS